MRIAPHQRCLAHSAEVLLLWKSFTGEGACATFKWIAKNLLTNAPALPVCAAMLLALSASRVDSSIEAITSFTLPAVAEPVFPERLVSIADFGAKPDGSALNTMAINAAIGDVAAQGGGRVVFPPGMWLTGPIELKNNVELHAEAGALVYFTPDLSQYGDARGLIWGRELENVAITGRGVFEGSGEAWRPVKKFKMTERQWKELLDQGGVLEPDGQIWWPSETAQQARRLRMVRIDQCKRVLIQDAAFRNSPQFALDFGSCDNLTIRNVTVKNDWFAQNGDGIDLHSCRNVQILGAKVDVGDDALCMKSNEGKPLENVLIRDCIVFHGHGGFVTGSEERGGMRNVRVENCVFLGTDVGLRFKSGRDRGGLVENIDIRGVRMVDIHEQAILFDMYYQQPPQIDDDGNLTPAPGPAPEITATTPRFRKIAIRDVICRGAQRAILLGGLPEQLVENIILHNVSIEAEWGMLCMDARNISLENVEILNKKGPVTHFYNAQEILLDGLKFPEAAETVIKLQGTTNASITIKGAGAAKERVTLIDGANAAVLKFE